MKEKIDRFLDFVKSKGGPSEVAKRIGKHPQIIYNIEQGKGKPNFETLNLIKEAYPDFDLNFIFSGKHTAVDSESTETKLLQLELAYLRAIAKDKGIEIPKPKGATLRPLLADQEGASEMLTESMFFGLLGRAVGRTQSRFFAKG